MSKVFLATGRIEAKRPVGRGFVRRKSRASGVASGASGTSEIHRRGSDRSEPEQDRFEIRVFRRGKAGGGHALRGGSGAGRSDRRGSFRRQDGKGAIGPGHTRPRANEGGHPDGSALGRRLVARSATAEREPRGGFAAEGQ